MQQLKLHETIKLFSNIFEGNEQKIHLIVNLNVNAEIWTINVEFINQTVKIVLNFQQGKHKSQSQVYFQGAIDREKIGWLQTHLPQKTDYNSRLWDVFGIYLIIIEYLQQIWAEEYIDIEKQTIKADQPPKQLNAFQKSYQYNVNYYIEQQFKALKQSIELMNTEEYVSSGQISTEVSPYVKIDVTLPWSEFQRNKNAIQRVKSADGLNQMEARIICDKKDKKAVSRDQIQQYVLMHLKNALTQHMKFDDNDREQISKMIEEAYSNITLPEHISVPNQTQALLTLIPRGKPVKSESNQFQLQFTDHICLQSDQYGELWRCRKKLENADCLVQILFVPSSIYPEYLKRINQIIQFQSQNCLNYVNSWIEFGTAQKGTPMCTIFIQQEFYSEITLQKIINEQLHLKMSQDELINLTAKLIAGLRAVHNAGFAHGNVHLESIFIQNSSIKWGDFAVGSKFTMNGDSEINEIASRSYNIKQFFQKPLLSEQIQQDIELLGNIIRVLWNDALMYNHSISLMLTDMENGLDLDAILKKYCAILQSFNDIVQQTHQNRTKILKMLISSSQTKKKEKVLNQRKNEITPKILKTIAQFRHKRQSILCNVPRQTALLFTQSLQSYKERIKSQLNVGYDSQVLFIEQLPVLQTIQMGIKQTMCFVTNSSIALCGPLDHIQFLTQFIQYCQKYIINQNDVIKGEPFSDEVTIDLQTVQTNKFLAKQFSCHRGPIVLLNGGFFEGFWQVELFLSELGQECQK